MTQNELQLRLAAFDVVLASKSPRRQQLLRELGLQFRVVNHMDMAEVYPLILKGPEIPVYLAKAKASCYENLIQSNTLLITADTIVWLHDSVIGKPADENQAVDMLKMLSGNMHEVYTGVCLKTALSETCFYACSKVYFRDLTDEEIRHYVETCRPLDKAGAYGVQEWIGYIGVERIEGSFYNVMGLPVQMVYSHLVKLLTEKI